MRIILVSFLIFLCSLGWVNAQEVPSSSPTPNVQSTVDKQSDKQSNTQSTQTSIPEKVTKTTFSMSQTDSNTFKKEQRLEKLRYRHLWIAFSLVWLITLVFVYRTWQRSQAVASRLDELKARLAQVEADKEKE